MRNCLRYKDEQPTMRLIMSQINLLVAQLALIKEWHAILIDDHWKAAQNEAMIVLGAGLNSPGSTLNEQIFLFSSPSSLTFRKLYCLSCAPAPRTYALLLLGLNSIMT